MEKFYRINNFSGGLSESDLIGPKGSFSESFGIDIHTTPGVITPADAPQKESGGTVTEFLPFAVDSTSAGTSFWFSDAGSIYRRSQTSTNVSWGSVYRKNAAAITGAAEFRGYIYWVSGQDLNRITTGGDWSSGVVAYGSVNSATYHQMVDMGLYLLIANGTTIASIDDTGTLTSNGIPDVTLNYLPASYQISSLGRYGIDVLIGTKNLGGVSGSKLLRWDLAAPTWTQDISVPESSVNCFLTTNDGTSFQAGNKGMIYSYNGTGIVPFKKIPIIGLGLEATTAYPQSSVNYKGIGYYGISNASQSKVYPGLYALGKKNSSYPISLCHQFPDTFSIANPSLYRIDIGAIISGYNSAAVDDYLIFSWRKPAATASYGVDSINNSAVAVAPVLNSFITTQAITGDGQKQKQFQNYNVSYRTKPASTNITLGYFNNFSTTQSGTITLVDQSAYGKMTSDERVESGSLKFKIGLYNNSSSKLEINEFYTDFDEREVL